MSVFLRKYNTLTVTGTTAIRIPMIKRGVVDFAVGADWTPASGDCKIAIDGAAAANVTNLPTAVAMGNGAYWEFILTAAELTCKSSVITIADSATKAVEDNAFIVETFGNASAMYQVDLSDSVRMGLTSLPNAAAGATNGLPLAVDSSGRVDVLKINGTSQTARDLGASVLLSAGSGTGQLDFTSGVVKASLVQILGTALTETAGQIAAAFKQFFNIATPAATMDHGVLVDTVTTYTGNTKQTGDAFLRIGAPAGASIAADIAAVKVDTAAVKVQTDKLAFTVPNQVDSNVIDWKGATAPAMTGDAFARLGAPAGASVSADVAAVKADTAAVKTQTDKLAFSVTNQVDANVLTVAGAASNIKKGQALANFEFLMTDSTNHNPATGLTVTANRSIDGGAFGACTNAVTELSNGIYKISLSSSDLNGNVITFRMTAAASDDQIFTIVTQP